MTATRIAIATSVLAAMLLGGPADAAVTPRLTAMAPLQALTTAGRDLQGIHIPVVLVDFPGRSAARKTRTPAAFRNMLFQENYSGGAGSLRDYYLDQSAGSFSITGQVASWHRAEHPYSHYAGSDNGLQDTAPNDRTLVAEAVAAADDEIDFCRADSDHNGLVDALFVIHSGPGAEETGAGIWSASWWLPTPLKTDDVCAGKAVSVQQFTIQPETYKRADFSAPNAPAKMVSIGVFAHELGHVLGLPDLYDTDLTNPGGVGPWDIMGTGTYGFDGVTPWRPAPMSAWVRAELGWAQVRNVGTSLEALELALPQPGQTPDILRVAPDASTTSKEYFLIENRKATGWAQDFPGNGFLIWHIDESRPDNDGTRHLVQLVQADGLNELGISRDFFEAGDIGDMWIGPFTFGPSTKPSSDLYGQKDSGITIRMKQDRLAVVRSLLPN